MKVKFKVKYGENVIDIPDNHPTFDGSGLSDKFTRQITIYNDIASQGDSPRRFDRHVIQKCSIQGGYVTNADGTIQNIFSATTVITKDTQRYISPIEYANLTLDKREGYYTIQIGDYIVLDEVNDEVTTGRELEALQKKYGNMCISVTSVTPNIFGTAVDNITVTNI